MRDLGEYCLKDLTRPEHIFQLTSSDLPSDFPRLKTLESHPNNLPAQPTALIGREKDSNRLYTVRTERHASLALGEH